MSDGLGGLREAFPGAVIWKGEHTGTVWAMLPQGGDLVNADTAEGMEAKLADAAAWAQSSRA